MVYSVRLGHPFPLMSKGKSELATNQGWDLPTREDCISMKKIILVFVVVSWHQCQRGRLLPTMSIGWVNQLCIDVNRLAGFCWWSKGWQRCWSMMVVEGDASGSSFGWRRYKFFKFYKIVASLLLDAYDTCKSSAIFLLCVHKKFPGLPHICLQHCL